MRTFVYSDVKSHKFWNIDLKGKSFTVTFGRQGTAGQAQTKTFPDESKAKKEHDKLVAEKLAKGYVETTPGAPAPASAAPAAAPVGGLRRFAYSDASSHKFWNIELKGKSFTVTYGRQGTAGQTQTKTFADEEKAQKEYDKLIAEKLRKGYSETTPASAPASMQEALEAALVADPDDLGSHMAYADYLSEQGDPRGEFIRVQLALEDPGKSAEERKRLQQQEKKLLKAHGRAWLGQLAPFLLDKPKGKESWNTPSFKYSYARGWLDGLEASNYTVAFTRALARAPQVRLLRRLVLMDEAYEEEGDYEPGDDIPEDTDTPQLYPLARARHLGNVRVFQLGEMLTPREEHQASDGGFNSQTSGDGVVGLIKVMPKLEELYLLARDVDADQLFSLRTLDSLRVLLVYHNTSYPLGRLAKNPSLIRLTHLLCHPHAMEEEAYIRLPGVKELVHSPHLPALTHLRLRLTDAGDKGVQEIIKSGILKRLKVLDLRHGCVTDKGAQALADCPDLTHLELLDLTNNSLTDAGIKALRKAGVKLVAAKQWRPTGDEWEDRNYLFAGDIE